MCRKIITTSLMVLLLFSDQVFAFQIDTGEIVVNRKLNVAISDQLLDYIRAASNTNEVLLHLSDEYNRLKNSSLLQDHLEAMAVFKFIVKFNGVTHENISRFVSDYFVDYTIELKKGKYSHFVRLYYPLFDLLVDGKLDIDDGELIDVFNSVDKESTMEIRTVSTLFVSVLNNRLERHRGQRWGMSLVSLYKRYNKKMNPRWIYSLPDLSLPINLGYTFDTDEILYGASNRLIKLEIIGF